MCLFRVFVLVVMLLHVTQAWATQVALSPVASGSNYRSLLNDYGGSGSVVLGQNDVD